MIFFIDPLMSVTDWNILVPRISEIICNPYIKHSVTYKHADSYSPVFHDCFVCLSSLSLSFVRKKKILWCVNDCLSNGLFVFLALSMWCFLYNLTVYTDICFCFSPFASLASLGHLVIPVSWFYTSMHCVLKWQQCTVYVMLK